MRQRIGLWLGPLLLLAILLLPRPEGLSSEAQRVGAVVAMMAIWWLLDAVPVAITALLPILLYPLLGVMKSSEVTPSYANHLIYLFLSGFLLALAIEKWGLHHRIALRTLAVMGHSPERVLLGFMLVTALLSMWMSATITAMMMLTVALALLHDEFGSAPSPYTERGRDQRAFATSLTLGIAYAASIGGAVTIVGSPPNAILAGILAQQHEMSLSLIGWMLMTQPVALVMLFGVWFYLSRIAYPTRFNHLPGGTALFHKAHQDLGDFSRAERRLIAVFALVVVGWIVRALNQSEFFDWVQDSTIALAGAVALFVIPSGRRPGEPLLDWKSAKQLPWEIILLFGGGFAIAQGFQETGLTEWLAGQLLNLPDIAPFWILLITTLFALALTEVTSNISTAALILPLVGAIAVIFDLPTQLLMSSAAIACSYAFMLPTATPANAIAYGSGYFSIGQMARTGLLINLLGALLVSGYLYLFIDAFAPLLFSSASNG